MLRIFKGRKCQSQGNSVGLTKCRNLWLQNKAKDEYAAISSTETLPHDLEMGKKVEAEIEMKESEAQRELLIQETKDFQASRFVPPAFEPSVRRAEEPVRRPAPKIPSRPPLVQELVSRLDRSGLREPLLQEAQEF